MEANRLHLLPKSVEGFENIGSWLEEKREDAHAAFKSYRDSENRIWNKNIFSDEFDADHPRFNFFGITEFTVYHFSMGFVSGFFHRDVEEELHMCLDDMGDWGEGLKMFKDALVQLKKNPAGFMTNWQLMQEAWNFGQDIVHNDDLTSFGACSGFANEFKEAFEWIMRHLNPAVWVANLI